MTVTQEIKIADFSKDARYVAITRRHWESGRIDFVVEADGYVAPFENVTHACSDFGNEVAIIVENAVKEGRL